MPPATQTPMKAASLPTLAATIAGVLKMPIPTTMPTMIVTASKTDRVGCGSAFAAAGIQSPSAGMESYDGSRIGECGGNGGCSAHKPVGNAHGTVSGA